MNHDHYPDALIRDVLTHTKSIAVVGLSPKPDRASHRVTAFLVRKGYRVVGVNPGHAGKVIAGAMTYATLSDVPHKIDMVDVFRAAEHLGDVIDNALNLANPPKVIWGQLTVRDDEAAKFAEEAGVIVIQDRCPAIEMPRLGL